MPAVSCYGSLAQLLPHVVHLMAVGYVVTRHRCVADLEGEPIRGLVFMGFVKFSQLVCISVVAWRCLGTITHPRCMADLYRQSLRACSSCYSSGG